MREPSERIRDIVEAIARIKRYPARGREAFDSDELIQSWLVRHIQIIGEAARSIPGDIRAKAPAVPWREIVGMRHILVHDYFSIDAEAVWKVATEDLPPLEAELNALLRLLEAGG